MNVAHRETESGGVFFVLNDGQEAARMEYKTTDGGDIVIEHTVVESVLKGKGVGKTLVAAAVEKAQKENFKIGATCSFAKSVLEKEDGYRNVYNSHLD